MEIAVLPEKLHLKVITSAICAVASVKRLMQISHYVNGKPQC